MTAEYKQLLYVYETVLSQPKKKMEKQQVIYLFVNVCKINLTFVVFLSHSGMYFIYQLAIYYILYIYTRKHIKITERAFAIRVHFNYMILYTNKQTYEVIYNLHMMLKLNLLLHFI